VAGSPQRGRLSDGGGSFPAVIGLVPAEMQRGLRATAIVGSGSSSGGPSGLYVYAKPTGGWSAATALTAGFFQSPANDGFGGLAVGRDLISVGEGKSLHGHVAKGHRSQPAPAPRVTGHARLVRRRV
jgi:hypothetical protein